MNINLSIKQIRIKYNKFCHARIKYRKFQYKRNRLQNYIHRMTYYEYQDVYKKCGWEEWNKIYMAKIEENKEYKWLCVEESCAKDEYWKLDTVIDTYKEILGLKDEQDLKRFLLDTF